MKALLSKNPGGPETLVLDEIPEPVPGSKEVRVAVRACGVNYPDLLIIQDLYQYKPPRPFAPGAEVAGVVDAVGEGVEHLRTGDRVLMSPVRNGMAEKAVVLTMIAGLWAAISPSSCGRIAGSFRLLTATASGASPCRSSAAMRAVTGAISAAIRLAR